MSVEIHTWRTRCNACGDVYGEYWDTDDEAKAYDEEGDGVCAECAEGTSRPHVYDIDPAALPSTEETQP